MAILSLNVTPFELGLLYALGLIAFPTLGLFVGVWVDRVSRRPVMIVCNLGRMISLALIPIRFALGFLNLYQLYATALVNGIFTVFFDVAYQSYLPVLIERSDLIEGNSKLQTSASGAQVAGQPLAGFLITFLGAARAIIADVIGYLVSALALLSIKKTEPKTNSSQSTSNQKPNFFGEMKEGIKVVTHGPILSRIAGCTATSNLGSSIVFSVYLIFAYKQLLIPVFLVTIIGLVGAIGFVVGAINSESISSKLGVGASLAVSSSVGFGLAAFPVAVLRDPILILMAINFVVSLGTPIYNIVQVSLRQAITPDHLQGRMNATMRTIVWGTLPAGSLIGGMLGTIIGVVPTMIVGGIVCGLSVSWILLGPVIKLKKQPEPNEVTKGLVNACIIV
jgi:MFS family permease